MLGIEENQQTIEIPEREKKSCINFPNKRKHFQFSEMEKGLQVVYKRTYIWKMTIGNPHMLHP